MKRQLVYVIGFVALSMIWYAGTARAGSKVEFEPVSGADWLVKEDSTKGIFGAAMLFEKVWVNDENWYKREVTVTYYRRIRILSEAGKQQADVIIPFILENQKIDYILGRTTRRDGEVAVLDKAQIVEKETIRASGVKVKQQSFSLPGISNDCITEYIICIKLKEQGFNFWKVQKDIYLFQGVLDWRLFRGKGFQEYEFQEFASQYVPQHIALNLPRQVDVQKLPSPDRIDELIFTVRDLPALKEETESLPSDALRAQMRFFYVDYNNVDNYWSDWSETIGEWCNDYSAKSDQCKSLAKQFESIVDQDAKVSAVCEWLQANVTNTSFMKDAERDKLANKYDNADEALKTGYADRACINFLCRQILRELGVKAQIAWVVDRDEDLLVQEAKYWQFDRPLVAVPVGNDIYRFYSPGDKYLPAGMVPWYCEGADALMESATGLIFQIVPFSPASYNKLSRTIDVRLGDDLSVSGTIAEERTGHLAAWVRRELNDAQPSEWSDKLKAVLKGRFTGLELDSLKWSGVDSVSSPLRLNAHASFPSAEQGLAGQRLLLKPLEYLGTVDNPFTTEKRRSPIMLDYALEREEAMSISLPAGWSVEGLPHDTSFQNACGKCSLHFERKEGALSVVRTFKVASPYAEAKYYPDMKRLYETYASLSTQTVMLTQATQ